MRFSSFLKENRIFLIPVLIFISTGIVFLFLFDKATIHLAQNSWYSPFGDVFFRTITHLGDGLVFLFGALLLMNFKWKYVIGLALTAILTVTSIGVLKKVVYKGEPRPVEFFKNIKDLRLVEGVEMNHWNSFPSGHTTAAFAFWGFLAFVSKNKKLKFSLFVIAGFAAYSRIYLSQHFLEDIVAGAFLGTLISTLSYWVMLKISWPWTDKKLSFK